LVELGARSMDLVDLEFLKLGCLAGKKMEWSCFLNLELRGSPKHTLSLDNSLFHFLSYDSHHFDGCLWLFGVKSFFLNFWWWSCLDETIGLL
jgi:hypothetical protein